MKKKGQGEIIFVWIVFISIALAFYTIKSDEKMQVSPEGLAFKEKCTSFCESRNSVFYHHIFNEYWRYSYCTCVINDEVITYSYSPSSGLFLKYM